MYYKAIWVILLAHILLFFFQEMSFVVGTVSGTDLGNLIRLNYSRKMSLFLWFSSELAIISADVQEVLGATIALKILFNFNLYVGKPLLIFLIFRINCDHNFGGWAFIPPRTWSKTF